MKPQHIDAWRTAVHRESVEAINALHVRQFSGGFAVTRGPRPQRGDLRLPLMAVDPPIDRPIASPLPLSWPIQLLGPSSRSSRRRSQRPQGRLRTAVTKAFEGNATRPQLR